jgi:hypothetical protein
MANQNLNTGIPATTTSIPYNTTMTYSSTGVGVSWIGSGTGTIANLPYINGAYLFEKLLKIGDITMDKDSYLNQVMVDKHLITIQCNIDLITEKVDKIKTDKFIYKQLYFIDESTGGSGKIYRFAFKEKIENKNFKEKLDELLDDEQTFLVQSDTII